MTKTNLFLLKFGTLQTVLMGLYHFYIPFQYNWSNYLEQKSTTINWSLFSLNNYFSFNLLVVALFLGYYLYRKKQEKEVIKILTSIILLFWIFSTVYQLIEPIPLPEHLKCIGYLLLGVAFLNGVIFFVPLISLIMKK